MVTHDSVPSSVGQRSCRAHLADYMLCICGHVVSSVRSSLEWYQNCMEFIVWKNLSSRPTGRSHVQLYMLAWIIHKQKSSETSQSKELVHRYPTVKETEALFYFIWMFKDQHPIGEGMKVHVSLDTTPCIFVLIHGYMGSPYAVLEFNAALSWHCQPPSGWGSCPWTYIAIYKVTMKIHVGQTHMA